MERITRNVVWRATSLGFLGLLLSLPSCSPGGYHGDGATGFWKDRHPGFFGKNSSERVLKHIDEQVEALNLTPAQKEKYASIRENVRSDLTGMKEMRTQFATEARQEIMKANPDPHALAAMLTQHAEKFHAFMEQNTRRFLEFYDILDDSQKAQVIEHLRNRMSRIHAESEIPGPSVGALRPPDAAGRAAHAEESSEQTGSKSIGELL